MSEGLDTRQAMAIGTAGFTAAPAVYRLEQADLSPAAAPVAVTGATGGVGSFAVDLLAARGYAVTVITGKAEAAPYLECLGAQTILARDDVSANGKPLAQPETTVRIRP